MRSLRPLAASGFVRRYERGYPRESGRRRIGRDTL
jgi:hypothetical protein